MRQYLSISKNDQMRPLQYGKVVLKKYCDYCGKLFKTNKNKQKYCCRSCSLKVFKSNEPLEVSHCEVCGKEFERGIYKQNKTCSLKCANILRYRNVKSKKTYSTDRTQDEMSDWGHKAFIEYLMRDKNL